jgi:hypothetical protein
VSKISFLGVKDFNFWVSKISFLGVEDSRKILKLGIFWGTWRLSGLIFMDWKGLTARNMSRIFMTGATGFLGARTLRTLLDMDDSVEIAVLIRPEANIWRIEEELKSSRVIAFCPKYSCSSRLEWGGG